MRDHQCSGTTGASIASPTRLARHIAEKLPTATVAGNDCSGGGSSESIDSRLRIDADAKKPREPGSRGFFQSRGGDRVDKQLSRSAAQATRPRSEERRGGEEG